MTHVITSTCIKDGLCVEECPVEAIVEAEKQYYINPEECIDCGACVEVCPSNSIFPDEELPDEHKASVEENAKHFA